MNRVRARSPMVGGLVVVVGAATVFAWKMGEGTQEPSPSEAPITR